MTGHREWNDAEFPPFAADPDIACRATDAEMFFPKVNGMYAERHVEQAKRICRRCPRLDECLTWALDTRQGWGIWGGTTPLERRKLIERTAA